MATGFNTQTGNGEYRLQFETDNKELFLLMQETARRCVDGKPQTNADRIRAMSDEELAQYLAEIGSEANNGVIYSDRPEEWLEYLKQPAEE